MRYFVWMTMAFWGWAVAHAQPPTCAAPFEVNLCPTESFLGHSVDGAANNHPSWTYTIFGFSLNLPVDGGEFVYRVNFPPGSTQISVTVSGMTDNSPDGMSGPATLFMKGNTCNTTPANLGYQQFNQTVTQVRVFNVAGRTSPLYFVMDHAESTPIQYNISFTATGYPSLPSWCSPAPVELFYCHFDEKANRVAWGVNNKGAVYKAKLERSADGERFFDCEGLGYLGDKAFESASVDCVSEPYFRVRFESEWGVLFSNVFRKGVEKAELFRDFDGFGLKNLVADKRYEIKVFDAAGKLVLSRFVSGVEVWSLGLGQHSGFLVLHLFSEDGDALSFKLFP